MIADRIRKLREESGLSQAELGRKLAVTRSSVNAWESGYSVPTAQYIIELSKLFNVSADYILEIDSKMSLNIDRYSEEQRKLIYSLLNYFDSQAN